MWIHLHDFSAIFTKRNNFLDFLFASLDDETIKVMGQLLLSLGAKGWSGRAMVLCNFKYHDVLIFWIKVQHGPTSEVMLQ